MGLCVCGRKSHDRQDRDVSESVCMSACLRAVCVCARGIGGRRVGESGREGENGIAIERKEISSNAYHLSC